MDFIGPLPSVSENRYILVLVDEYSRYPFAFPCKDMETETVKIHLLSLFALFGSPSCIHSDRGAQFESKALQDFLFQHGVLKSRTTPYHPQGNGQCERINGSILKTINLALQENNLEKSHWEKVLNKSLSSIRSLLCISSNSTPHDRMFKFQRSSVIGCDLPNFLRNNNQEILLKRHIRLKNDPLVDEVKLIETISPYFAKIQHRNGKIDTVSTSHLAPSVEETNHFIAPPPTIIPQPTHDTICPFESNSPEEPLEPIDPEPLPALLDHTTKSGRHVKLPARFKS